MKVEFTIKIREHIDKKRNSWTERHAYVRIEARKETIDKVVEALLTIPDTEIE